MLEYLKHLRHSSSKNLLEEIALYGFIEKLIKVLE